tara:strand:+ start:508 stop:729 length:222 start_codon:yes stop_codon:yes gene_type:complete
MERRCIVCDILIPEGRLKILPNTRTCVEHSTTSAYNVRPVHTGTSADNAMQDIAIIKDPEAAAEYDRLRDLKL